jgi:hypothetical protein
MIVGDAQPTMLLPQFSDHGYSLCAKSRHAMFAVPSACRHSCHIYLDIAFAISSFI